MQDLSIPHAETLDVNFSTRFGGQVNPHDDAHKMLEIAFEMGKEIVEKEHAAKR